MKSAFVKATENELRKLAEKEGITLTEIKSNRKPKKLSKFMKGILLTACDMACSYDPDEALRGFEEHMNGKDTELARGFLGWVAENEKIFGYATIDERYAEYLQSLAIAKENKAFAKSLRKFGDEK